MPCIKFVNTVLPPFVYTMEQVEEIGTVWLDGYPEKEALFRRFLRNSHTEKRHFVLPPSQILDLKGLGERTTIFERHGVALGSEALGGALKGAQIQSEQVDVTIFTSCSCPVIPSIDTCIVENIGLKPTVSRVPIYQYGCAGGVIGLGLAGELSGANKTVALLSVELCSLVFQPQNIDAAQLVGAAIFADGAACAIILPEEEYGLIIRGRQSFLIPNTRTLMGYDNRDDGFHLRLDNTLPSELLAVVPEVVDTFIQQFGITTEEIPFWLIHPGGMKIVTMLEKCFRLRPEQASWARTILTTVGNLSSATILYVLKAFMNDRVCKKGDHVIMLGIGPGLTIELVLFTWGGDFNEEK